MPKVILVANASGVILDYLVALAEDIKFKNLDSADLQILKGLDYHKNWLLSGKIMEKENIFPTTLDSSEGYLARTNEKKTIKNHNLTFVPFGKTPIEAVLRCYVGHKLGSEITIEDDVFNKLSLTQL